jgi:uncharacterized protein (TIGR01777 family)
MKDRILIAGGTGLVGRELIRCLLAKGFLVSVLSRSPQKSTEQVAYFTWDVKNKHLDPNCFEGVTSIIHLAGENVASGRWSSSKKQRILKSRTQAADLFYEGLSKNAHCVSTFVSASATGYYGSQTTETVFSEEAAAGTDFLAHVCKHWEASIDRIASLGIRTVKLRTGIVFAKTGSALQKMVPLFKMGLGSAVGSGKQYMPWIHISDLCRMYMFALKETQVEGSYNAVVGDDLTNAKLSKLLARQLKKPFFMPAVPAWVLHLVLGEMAALLTRGSRVSSKKVREAGFVFEYASLENALHHLLET